MTDTIEVVEEVTSVVEVVDVGPQGPASGGGIPAAEDWHVVGDPGEPAFASGASSDPTSPARFYKDALGEVHLSGLILLSGDPEGFTLPTGYRPSQGEYFGVLADFFIVGTDGLVASGASTDGIVLSGSFRAA